MSWATSRTCLGEAPSEIDGPGTSRNTGRRNEVQVQKMHAAAPPWLHQRARQDWGFGKHEQLSSDDLIAEKYRGIRPAPGYPACPDHTEKPGLFQLLDAEKVAGMSLTENFAMTPAASVCGLYFGHPESRYFAVDRITREQVQSYAVRKGMPEKEIERWLAPNLGYDP